MNGGCFFWYARHTREQEGHQPRAMFGRCMKIVSFGSVLFQPGDSAWHPLLYITYLWKGISSSRVILCKRPLRSCLAQPHAGHSAREAHVAEKAVHDVAAGVAWLRVLGLSCAVQVCSVHQAMESARSHILAPWLSFVFFALLRKVVHLDHTH